MTTAAFRATDSRVEASAYALMRRVSSLTKDFPALPEGTLNRLFPMDNFAVATKNGMSEGSPVNTPPSKINDGS